MKYAILGGTFNPVHYGHLFLAEEVRLSLAYDYIIFIPSNIPALKTTISSISPLHRYNMLKAAVKPYAHYLADDCELKRGGVSYTIETVLQMQKKYGGGNKLGLIIGDDLVKQFPLWKAADEIAVQTEIIVVKRNFTSQIPFAYTHKYIDNKILPISASEIRARIAANQGVRFLIPDKVYDYIKKHKLYK